MLPIQIHEVVTHMISFFHRIGFWHRGEKPTAIELGTKWFYSIFYIFFIISVAVGAVLSESNDDAVFLAQTTIIATVLYVKIWFLIWNQKGILKVLHRICIFTIRDEENFTVFYVKLNLFMKCVVVYFLSASVAAFCEAGVVPFIGSERKLFFAIAFPFDWKHEEFAFWLAYVFICTEVLLSLTAFIFSIFIWCLLYNCSLRYEVLGRELTNMGRVGKRNDLPVIATGKHKNYSKRLRASIDAHRSLNKSVSDVEAFFSTLFFINIATGALSICGSIYCLAFNVSENFVERMVHLITLLYNIADIFMLTYLGNEIMLSSDRLSHCLFESQWADQPQSTKRIIITFGEYLKRPQKLSVGKLYSLTMETFTKILNSAYSMFNILKTIKK